MTRDEIILIVSTIVGDELIGLRRELTAHVEQQVSARALPPFTPPPAWTAGRHGAGVTVRHRNGLFVARRDTESEPGRDEAWLPLLVGVAGLDIRWSTERTVAIRAALSDGTQYEMLRTLAVPIVRGYWSPDQEYEEGDRVFRFGEFHALQSSRGVEPGTPGSEETWLKVGGKNKRDGLKLALDDEGQLSENGHVIGTFKPLIGGLLDDLVARRSRRGDDNGR